MREDVRQALREELKDIRLTDRHAGVEYTNVAVRLPKELWLDLKEFQRHRPEPITRHVERALRLYLGIQGWDVTRG